MRIRIGDRTLFETFDHYIYEADLSGYSFIDTSLKMVLINKQNIEEAGNAVGNTTKKWINERYPFVNGYYFLNDKRENIGSCWVMYKGGNEKLYRVREHDSFIFRVQVNEPFRGTGYSKQIMYSIFNELKHNGCKDTCLVCARKNAKANSLYQSLNMKKTGNRMFVRIFNTNIPYYSI